MYLKIRQKPMETPKSNPNIFPGYVPVPASMPVDLWAHAGPRFP